MDTQSSDASNRNYVSQWWSNPPTLCNTMIIQFSGIMEPNDDLIRWHYVMMTQSLDINVTHWWTNPSILWQPMMTSSSSLCHPMLIESYETARTNGEPDIINRWWLSADRHYNSRPILRPILYIACRPLHLFIFYDFMLWLLFYFTLWFYMYIPCFYHVCILWNVLCQKLRNKQATTKIIIYTARGVLTTQFED